MNKTYNRWVRRSTPDGDAIYDRDSRKVYRNRLPPMISETQDLWSLPTFQTEAPLKVYFDFSYFCNLECRHCITNSSSRADRKKELKSERIMAVMDELAAIGVLELGIGGGEPLCHSDIFRLLTHAVNLQLTVVLTTNGVLVTPEIAKHLNEIGVSEVRVSFDGSEPVHDSIRGNGRYQQALKAVKMLLNSGVNTVPRVTLCNDDRSGIDTLFREFKSVGANSTKVSLVEPQGRAALKENQDLFKYPRDDTTALFCVELAQKNGIALMLPSDLAILPELLDGGEIREGKRKSCGSGLETAYISPEGNVQPCSGTPNYPFGSVKSDRFMKVWTSPSATMWRQQACSNCSYCLCLKSFEIIENVQSLGQTPTQS